ncbi:hypothetical protein [Yoonia sp. R2-816]|uniref:hypothetical protein n=1 Tax=Yoonia sp. R2-816 TaxID=3342638 RepID=UPI00372859EE
MLIADRSSLIVEGIVLSDEDIEYEEKEFARTITSLERQRIWTPLFFLGFTALLVWLKTGKIIGQTDSISEAYGVAVLFFLYVVFTELTNIKIMLIKAQRRDRRRELLRQTREN